MPKFLKKLPMSLLFAKAARNSGNSNSTRLSTRVKKESDGSPIDASNSSLLVTDEAIASLSAKTRSLLAISGPAPARSEYMSTTVSSNAPSSAFGPQIDSRKISLTVFLPVRISGSPATIEPAVSRALQIASPMISQTFTISLSKTETIAR